jgi:mitotic spindle assembly checkpoint protein MAD2
VSTDAELQEYLKKILSQLQAWLENGEVRRLVLVISDVDTQQIVERWTFFVETDAGAKQKGSAVSEKKESELSREIGAIMIQITSAVSFLPMLPDRCTFDVLVYTPNDSSVPKEWEESDPKYIPKSHSVRFGAFSTKIHRVETAVSYKAPDDE